MKCSTEENVDLVNDLILSHEDTPQTQSVCLCVYACLFDRAKAEQCWSEIDATCYKYGEP